MKKLCSHETPVTGTEMLYCLSFKYRMWEDRMQHPSFTLLKQGLEMSKDRDPSINKNKSMTLTTVNFINFTGLKLNKESVLLSW